MATGARNHPRSVAVPPANENTESIPDMPFEEGAHDVISADLRHRLISDAAYRLYEQRGYSDGYDLDDWLQAEATVDHLLLNPKTDNPLQ